MSKLIPTFFGKFALELAEQEATEERRACKSDIVLTADNTVRG